jgi:LPS-assembly lipoprotein
MSWSEFPRFTRLLLALALAGLTAGCFQPLYGDKSTVGGPGISEKMKTVTVPPVNSTAGIRLQRVGIELRNEVIYGLTGGGAPATPNYKLTISISSTNLQVIVDVNTNRPDFQNYGIDASYQLIDLGTGKIAVTGSTFARVSYNIPGQEQRFAGERGLRDAENRAAQVIAENIRNRLASHFAAGT